LLIDHWFIFIYFIRY